MSKNKDNPVPVSAYMITFNNERTVEQALQSLAWADEIVVVDSFSTDGTPEIAKRYAHKFEQRDWPGFREQYRYAAGLCSNRWAVFLDADEVIPPNLVTEIRVVLRKNLDQPEEEQTAAFYIPRRTWYLGRWIRHGGWVPDREIRLYNRDRGDWEGGLHAAIQTENGAEYLKTPCLHYTYANISDHLQTIDKYSTTAAQDMLADGKTFSYFKTLTRPPSRFARDYFLKLGFLDGFAGLVIAIATGFYVFIKNAKLKELERVRKKS